MFSDIGQAYRFLIKSAELMGWARHEEGGFVLHTMLPLEDGVPRAEVRFSPVLLPDLTEMWEESAGKTQDDGPSDQPSSENEASSPSA